jgi:hypothetical protein
VAVWFKRPIIDSRFFKEVFFVVITCLISWVHWLYFFDGSDKVRDLVFTFHPKIVTDSDIMPSSASFSKERQSSRCIGSLGSRGRNRVCIASKIAATPLSLL